MNNQERVKKWMKDAGLEMPVRPTEMSLEVRKCCARLYLEEVLETINNGLGIDIRCKDQSGTFGLDMDTLEFEEHPENDTPNLVELADGLADTEFVEHYIANKFGIIMQPVFDEVCRSNESKFNWSEEGLRDAHFNGWKVTHLPDGKHCVTDQNGKIRKSPDYSKADIAPILRKQIAEAPSRNPKSYE